MNQLVLAFFGSFEAMLGNQPLINFRSAKIQGLLIYLSLTQHQAHGRDTLAALFWPDESETIAKQNLRQSLYRLRLVLEDTTSKKEPYLLINRATVQFNTASDFALDVHTFRTHLENEQQETAVTLYQGDLLAGFSCDSLPFDEWLRSEREKLHWLALDALFELTAQSITRADFQKAQRLAQQQLTLEPWREEAHQQLMQALALQGNRSAALTQYETCCRVLMAELGIDPMAKTKALAARIRDQQLDPHMRRYAADSPEQQPMITPFVGRHREYETLVKAYRQVTHSTFQLVSLVGNAGMGKTRLAQQFLTWAATQGADVLVGRAYETSSGLSYQPLTHLLRQRIERENAPEDLLSDLWLSQLTRLLPELRDRYPDLPEPTQEENTAKQHLFEAITRLGQALAERQPLLLFIDDCHWADAASLDLLQYAAQRWMEEKTPIFMLLTLRQEVVTESADLQSWLNQIKRTVAAAQLNLGVLSQAEIKQLVRSLLTANDKTALTQFSHWLYKETDGQPLFLTEALKVLAEAGLLRSEPKTTRSTSLSSTGIATWHLEWSRFDARSAQAIVLTGVREIIQGWLSRVSEPAGELLAATAVLAQEASFDNLCQVSGMAESQTVRALDELLKRQLLLETDGMQLLAQTPIYTFSHYKVSEVIYAEAGAARRRMLHRRAFKTLQNSGAAAAECANHALQAGLLAKTIRYTLMAGNEAMALFAHRTAIGHYETARQVVEQNGWPEAISGADRQVLYTGLGKAYEMVVAWEKAQETYQSMIAHARRVGATALECQGLNRLASVYDNGLKDPQRTLVLLEEARAVAEQNDDLRGIAETECNIAHAAVRAQKASLGLHHAEKALPLVRQLGHPDLLVKCLAAISMSNAQLRRWEQGAAEALEISQLSKLNGNLINAAYYQSGVGFCQMMSGHTKEALKNLQEVFTFAQNIEHPRMAADVARILALTEQELGLYGQAIRHARYGVEQSQTTSVPRIIMLTQIAWGTVLRKLMALELAQTTCLDVFAKASHEAMVGWITDAARSELCALHALSGDWEGAYVYAKQALAASQDDLILLMGLTFWYETEALLRGGDGNLARREVERVAALVGENRRYRLPLLRSQAVLAQWDGDVAQAITHLQAALALAQEIGLPGEEWPILGALGGLYTEQGEEAMAQQTYQDAAVIIYRLAETIDEEEFRAGFLAAGPVRSILEISELV